MTAPIRVDSRDSVTRGRGAIVLRVNNNYGFHEHASIVNAKAEAARLVERLGGKFVIYVPVATIEPAPKVLTTDLVSSEVQQQLNEDIDMELPF